MRAVVQLVKQSSITVNQQTTGTVGKGFLVLLGVNQNDNEKQA